MVLLFPFNKKILYEGDKNGYNKYDGTAIH